MADISLAPEEMFQMFTERIGVLEMDNLMLRALLKKAGEQLDELRSLSADIVGGVGHDDEDR